MYDYIELHANKDYSRYLTIEEFNRLFVDCLNIKKSSNASFIWDLNGHSIKIQGIRCDYNGNYSFNSDSGFRDVNLIEINLPQGSESDCYKEIREFISEIAARISWKINWRE